MKIAIFDIDDTITQETEFMMSNARRFLRQYELSANVINPNGYNLDQVYDITGQLVAKGMQFEEAAIEAQRLINKFWNKNFLKYNLQRTMPGVAECIRMLKQNGYQIHFVTLRGRKTQEYSIWLNESIRNQIVMLITRMMLRKNLIPFDSLHLVSTQEEKIEYIKYLYPDIMFEDQSSIIQMIEEYDPTIKKICIARKHNEQTKLSDNVIRISDFRRDSKEIKAIINCDFIRKKKRTLKNVTSDFFQYIVKVFGGWYFQIKYKPIVIGQKRIPEKGGIIFVGNHRDKIDPVFVSIYAKKSIHWAALLRMFQGKEDLFNLNAHKWKRWFSAWFIKAMGALPIARPTDDNYEVINQNTINQLTAILQQNGVVGFFPEGTINRKPDETNVLPLKSNRVFRMAVETDTYIQPFSIVWNPERLKSKHKLIIVFSMPINTYGRNKKEVRDMWLQAVNDSIEMSKNMFDNLGKR